MTRNLRVLLVLLCVTIPYAALTIAAEIEAFELSLHGKESIGDVFRVEAASTFHTIDLGREGERSLGTRETKYSAEIRGRMTILALGQNLHASKVKVKIDTLKLMAEGKSGIDARPGDELVLERKNQPNEKGTDYVGTLNGNELTLMQLTLVASVIDLARPQDKDTFNHLYNVTGRKRPGDSWLINADTFMGNLAGNGVKTAKGQIPKRTMTFTKIIEDDGHRYALLTGEFHATGFAREIPRVTIISNEVKTLFTLQVPLDGKTRKFISETDQTTKTVSDNQMSWNGNAWALRKDTTQTVHKTFRIALVPTQQ